ncbi:Cysteine desulfurase IscS [bioreactor metagenome]|uniref:Cysteine desulfurase IscS n=1 Tax=bioreactor metagenome TaxID=1076179 RepID=A0A644T666_9ZZZZ|nr:cysteine desulfurase family protein [Candidatus Elulimicrobiales bacterium]
MKKATKIELKNNERVYLDFASQTMPSKKVLAEMKKVGAFNFNPANLYKEGLESENILEEARTKIARVLGVREHEIYFTNSGTLSCASAIFGIFNFYKEKNKNNKNYVKPHIVTSNIEHEAVLKNIEHLEKMGEIEATYISCDENGLIDPVEVKKAIKENTILVSIMYVNNEIGTIQDIKNIGKKIKEWKKEKEQHLYPYFHTDAAQAGNYLSLYIDMLGVDLLSLNGSKIYGPKSSGILFKKEAVKISPFYFGGGQERNIFSGTVDIEKATGLAVAIEEAQKKIKDVKFLEEIAVKRNTFFKNILKNIPEAKLNGAWNENEWKKEKIGIVREERIPNRIPSNISLYLPDFPSDEMVLRLDNKGFSISAGSACSAKSDEYSHVIYALYKNNKKVSAKKIAQETIRITLNSETKEKDLERFTKVLKEIYYKFKK